MAKKKSGLGRGLNAVISEIGEAYDNGVNDNSALVLELDIDIIKPNPYQPRKTFKQEALRELADSIKEHGVLQPVVVYDNGDGDYVLIAGERRLRASKMADKQTIRAIVADIDIKKLRELAIIENIQREELNPIELALSYQELLVDYDITHDELSKRLGKSRTQITNTLRLLNLHKAVQEMLIDEKITQGHAKMLVVLDLNEQKMIADSIVGQKLNVRETESLIKKIKGNQDKVTIKKDVKKFIKSKIDENLIEKLQDELKKLGLKSQFSVGKISIFLQNDTEVTTLIEKFLK